MEKFLEMFKKHPFRCAIVIFLILVIVPTIFVHCIYKIPAPCENFKYVIPPGNLLAYIGTVLTFCATFTLSMIVYISNRDRERREQLFKNRTFVTIPENQEVGIDIIDFTRKEMADIFINLEISFLSDATITKICMKFLSIEERIISKQKRSFTFDFLDDPQSVTFPYMDRKKTQISLSIKDVRKDIAQFLKESSCITIAFDIDFICDKVKTPYTITLDLKKKPNEEQNSIKYCFIIENIYAHYQNPEFC